MKIIHISHSDIQGGAARAAYRIHQALRLHGLDSTMAVNVATSGDWTVQSHKTKLAKGLARLRPQLGSLPRQWLRTDNPILHSPAIIPSTWSDRLNCTDADVLHLHWVNGEMLSIPDITKLGKPVVWTLHDMWAFCGAEHYTEEFRWCQGYWKDNRPSYESGFDLNRWTWNRKRKHWQKPLQIVTPSQWLADCVTKSALMADWPVRVVPNTINTDIWQPFEKNLARKLLHLPLDVPLLLFGALNGSRDPRKGFDLLQAALNHLRGQMPGLQLVVFGQLAPKEPIDLGFPIHYMGRLHDELSLRILYSAADVMIIPSRQDNLPNTGLEAHACGTPVIAFNTCGLPDIVEHLKTGYLAKAFDTTDLAHGIQWLLSDFSRLMTLGLAARQRAVDKWSVKVVADAYQNVYNSVLVNK
ncbi:glycosyltransferase family 4 protein [Anabaenopsis tanganyikae CS-531]|uniref:Glycosyltransferase family 4 protein n=2 Tax=Anabaenopsis TaxID=110103 RepID=A0ABT5AWY4_9CYAN|nr:MULTISPECIES: glycosyltransferase family 4 protein [Anabaenopsis]MDB9541457.1 glycosyltransferase family 4 protein [Anabaenopsis arnoldii]MDH6090436.1 glycosyltransferase family 4 protein [Anabaenopsis arnoldii]MDH6105380.1 glycosyltransferase family 4 protein [Anabaenopsis tanganyikae CS-531]